MAPSPRGTYTSVLLTSLFVFLLLSFSHAARVAATVRNQAVQDRRHGEVRTNAKVDAGDEEAASFSTAATEEDERCGNGGAGVQKGDEEECLMRRTLVAHTDYIYTQGGNHN
ncbi:unnamed protein product [Alopecurus aequalis]